MESPQAGAHDADFRQALGLATPPLGASSADIDHIAPDPLFDTFQRLAPLASDPEMELFVEEFAHYQRESMVAPPSMRYQQPESDLSRGNAGLGFPMKRHLSTSGGMPGGYYLPPDQVTGSNAPQASVYSAMPQYPGSDAQVQPPQQPYYEQTQQTIHAASDLRLSRHGSAGPLNVEHGLPYARPTQSSLIKMEPGFAQEVPNPGHFMRFRLTPSVNPPAPGHYMHQGANPVAAPPSHQQYNPVQYNAPYRPISQQQYATNRQSPALPPNQAPPTAHHLPQFSGYDTAVQITSAGVQTPYIPTPPPPTQQQAPAPAPAPAPVRDSAGLFPPAAKRRRLTKDGAAAAVAAPVEAAADDDSDREEFTSPTGTSGSNGDSDDELSPSDLAQLENEFNNPAAGPDETDQDLISYMTVNQAIMEALQKESGTPGVPLMELVDGPARHQVKEFNILPITKLKMNYRPHNSHFIIVNLLCDRRMRRADSVIFLMAISAKRMVDDRSSDIEVENLKISKEMVQGRTKGFKFHLLFTLMAGSEKVASVRSEGFFIWSNISQAGFPRQQRERYLEERKQAKRTRRKRV